MTDLAETLQLLLRIIEHLLLICLPALLACTLAVRRGVRDFCVLILIALVAVAGAGYLTFWLYFFSRKVGHLFAFLLPLVCGAFAFWALRQIDVSGRRTLRSLLAPTLLVFAATAFILSAGFMYGGFKEPPVTAKSRFSHLLPEDHSLPFLFAEELGRGSVSKPMFIDWLSSDRPPLQTGIALLQYPYMPRPRNLGYMLTGVLLQSLWIPALWCFLRAAGLGGRVIALSLIACLFSGLVIVNSFFVWPKLLAAAYMLAFTSTLLTDRLVLLLRERPAFALLSGALLAFGLLSHGGSAFALFGLAPVVVLLRKRVSLKSLALILVSCTVLYTPWILYQKLFDPPGDRLLKWHLAGVVQVDKRPFGEVLRSAYQKMTWRQIAEVRLSNLEVLSNSPSNYGQELKQFISSLAHLRTNGDRMAQFSAEQLRASQFFHFVPQFGFLVFGPIFLLAGLRKSGRNLLWQTGATCWLLVVSILIVWCSLIYEPAVAVIHRGTYSVVLLAFVGSVLAIAAVSGVLATVFVGLHVAYNVSLYLIFGRPPRTPGAAFDGAFHPGQFVLMLLSVALIFILLRRLARARDSDLLLEPPVGQNSRLIAQ